MDDARADGCSGMGVKRYNITAYHFNDEPVYVGYATELAEDGDFCLADDVAEIIAERTLLRDVLRRLIDTPGVEKHAPRECQIARIALQEAYGE